jgi:hypothetical protein
MLDENQYSFSMHFVHMNVPNSYEKLVFTLFLSLKWGPRIGELSWPKDDKPLNPWWKFYGERQKTWIGQVMIKKSYMSGLAFQKTTHNLGSWSTIWHDTIHNKQKWFTLGHNGSLRNGNHGHN